MGTASSMPRHGCGAIHAQALDDMDLDGSDISGRGRSKEGRRGREVICAVASGKTMVSEPPGYGGDDTFVP